MAGGKARGTCLVFLITIVSVIFLSQNTAAVGCVVPPDGMIVTSDTVLCSGSYILPNGIRIGANSVTLDCNGSVLNGNSSWYPGINMSWVNYSTVRNCSVTGYYDGIFMEYSDNNTVTGSRLRLNRHTGITVNYGSDSNTISYSEVSYNGDQAAWGGGISVYGYYNNISGNIIQSNNGLNGYGVYLSRQGNSVGNNTICFNSGNGIDIRDSQTTANVSNNSVCSNSNSGINVESQGKTLSGNRMWGNKKNIVISPYQPYRSNIDPSNTISGKPVYCVQKARDTVIPENAGFIYIMDSVNVTVRNVMISGEQYGVYMYNTTNSTVMNSSFYGNVDGIFLYMSGSNVVTGNSVHSTEERGISIEHSENNTVAMNNVSGNKYGVSYSTSSIRPDGNAIERNSITGNSGCNFCNSQGNINISVENNWWGCVEGWCVRAGITNYYPNYVNVDYEPWLFGPPGENQLPLAGGVECNDGSGWANCSKVGASGFVRAVRARCTDVDGLVESVTFRMENGSYATVFEGNGTFDGTYYAFDNTDVSANTEMLRLTATCTDTNSSRTRSIASWTPRKGLPRSITFYEGFDDMDAVSLNNGTAYNSPTAADGIVGRSMDFSGGEKKVCYPVHGNINGTNWTVEFWVKPPAYGGLGFFDIGWLMNPNSLGIFKNANYLIMEVKNENNNFDQAWSLNSWPSTNKWFHVAAVWERQANTTYFKVFLDGQGKTSYDGSIDRSFPNMSASFCLGWSGWYGSSESVMDEVRIYNYVRSDSEVMQDYLALANASKGSMQKKPCAAGSKPESTAAVKVNCSGMFVDGKPFKANGLGYQPMPIGLTADVLGGSNVIYNTPAIYNRDFALLREMNANAIRTWSEVRNRSFLDAAWNGGVKPVRVLMGFWINCNEYYGNAALRQSYIQNFTDYVNMYKSHPAVLGWLIGNENNLGYCSAEAYLDDFYSLANELARTAYELEGASYHPVGIVNGDIFNIGLGYYKADDASLGHVDFWGSNIYRGFSFGDAFEEYGSLTGKPLLITEYGIDALDNRNYAEQQATHASWVANMWKEINASNVTIGSTIMEYSDEWWKAGSQSSHDYGGYATTSHPDGYANEEWWGVMRTVDNGTAADIMQPRQAYYTLRALWYSGLKGDIDRNCVVNIFDLARVGVCFGKPATGGCIDADATGDSKIDIFDLATVGINYDRRC